MLETKPKSLVIRQLKQAGAVVAMSHLALWYYCLMSSDCIFCSIVDGQTPADVVSETETTLFFRDINPQAPVHVLGITKEHISSVAALDVEHDAVIGALLRQAGSVADQLGVKESGFRVTTNTGSDADQSVPHVHVHVLGGEPLGKMRC